MIKVNNKRAVRNLAYKSFKAAKSRNSIAIIAIALTTILFTSLFTVGIGIVESVQNQTLRQAGGDGHIALKYLTEAQYQNVKNHHFIDQISYNKTIADSVDNKELLKRRAEMYYMDQTAMELGFCEPTVGNAPKLENEIATDTMTLDLLGVPHEIGATVSLIYTIKDTKYESDFVLAGYWESDPTFNVGFVLVSEAFTKVNANLLTHTVATDQKISGSINAYILCKNSFNLEEKMYRIVTESGYTFDDNDYNTPALETDISCNTNWAYLGSGSLDIASMIGILMGCLLIVFTGYLMIYNVFQISVQRDIRFYGLLKTIGTTGKQIKRIITRQAAILSLIGIPIGLILGFSIGKAILPMIMETTTCSNGAVVSINPVIFMGASIFSLFTVFLSTKRPGQIAASVSPVEAVRYSGSEETKRKEKKSQSGGKIYKMAFSNLARNKKRTMITIISMSLSLVLLNTVFTLSKGFDMDKFLSTFVDTDYLVGHVNYFNLNRFRMPEDGASENMIEAIKSQDGFLEGGRLYKNIYIGQCMIKRENPNEQNRWPTNFTDEGMPMLDLYGLDDLPLSRLDIVEGKLDLEKLKTGQYIIEGLDDDDDGSIYAETSHYAIGDLVTIQVDGKTYTYELMAKARVKYFTNTDRSASNYTMYLPSEAYLEIVTRPLIMSYAFNVQEGKEHEMENFLDEYTEKIEPMMNYDSKEKYVEEFKGMQTMIVTVGGILSGIVGLIGVLNFINSILTSILTRRREFATLQSIGMTKKQLINLLTFEGGYYALFTIGVSLVLGIAFSVGVVGGVVSNLWLFSYKFVVLPLICTYPILILLSLIIPYLAYHSASKQSIVERLREVE